MHLRQLSQLVIFVWCSVALMHANDDTCPLHSAKSGTLVKIRGSALHGAHDAVIRPVGCEENVILVWGDDPSLGPHKIGVRRDAEFLRFNELLRATFPLPPNVYGTGQTRYRVVAEFEGRLEISDDVGLIRDPKTTKVIRVEGFGSPLPFTRFRIVATSVSAIEAREEQQRQQ